MKKLLVGLALVLGPALAQTQLKVGVILPLSGPSAVAGKAALNGIQLAADEDKAAASAYGVWVEKSMYGRKYMGVERSTFLIGPTGKVVRSWRKVKVPGHADEVLAAVKALKA